MDKAAPLVDAAYQSIVSPAATLADIGVLEEPKQTEAGTPDVGTPITGQLQSGALTGKVAVQPFNVAVKVTFVPFVIPVTVFAALSTTPDEEATEPLLTKTIL